MRVRSRSIIQTRRGFPLANLGRFALLPSNGPRGLSTDIPGAWPPWRWGQRDSLCSTEGSAWSTTEARAGPGNRETQSQETVRVRREDPEKSGRSPKVVPAPVGKTEGGEAGDPEARGRGMRLLLVSELSQVDRSVPELGGL